MKFQCSKCGRFIDTEFHQCVEDFQERFWRKVHVSDGCWEWTAGRSGDGYGTFHVGKEFGQDAAHRVAFELFNAIEIPFGLLICHKCDNPICCRPDHLFLGTHQENRDDSVIKERRFSPFRFILK